MSLTREQLSRRTSERGSVTVMTAVLMVGLCLVLGLSIDVARIYMVRSGLQNAADAAALAAARELNSGTAGLTEAEAHARSSVLQNNNKYGLNRSGGTASSVAIETVAFAADKDGPWYVGATGASGIASTVRFVRVTTQIASINTLFAGSVLGAPHTEQRTAIAGMSVGLNTICNFFPIAVSLTNPFPANHTQFTFNFTDVGTSVTLVNRGYVVLEVPDIPGTGAAETAKLAAGITKMSASIGGTLRASSSANFPRAIADGTNTRFGDYKYGYLTPALYPPDTNIAEGLTGTQYLNKSPLAAPGSPGKDDRRILVMPILPTGTYLRTSIPTTRFGAFLLRSRAIDTGDLMVEYLGDALTHTCGSFNPDGPSSTLTKPVLYR